MECPFTKIHDTHQRHAELLAMAFKVAHDSADIWPAGRMARAMTDEDILPYLDGCHFAEWVDNPCSHHILEPHTFDELQKLANEYLDRR
jgi:hypothetical protein